MARIAGVDIPKDKKVAYSLRYVHGIGLKTAIDTVSYTHLRAQRD